MDIPLPWFLFASVAAVALGTFFFIRSRRAAARHRAFERRSLVTTGEIISLRATRGRRNGNYYWMPTVRFDAPDNVLVTAEASTGSNPAPGKPGDRVRVRFDRENPEKFHLADSFAQPSTINTMHGCLGVGFVLFGLVAFGLWALIVLVLEIPV